MPQTKIFIELSILVISFIIGISVYYLISKDPKEAKKKQLEDIISLTINFIIYIWIGKIVTNIAKFIKDPLSILAYPSNSYAVYVATILIMINLLYRKYRYKEQISIIIFAFIPVFILSSFVFEFIQLVIVEKTHNWYYLLFLAVLSLGYVIIYGKISKTKQSFILGISLLIGQFLLAFANKLTIFGYRLSASYFVVLMIVVVFAIFTNMRKV